MVREFTNDTPLLTGRQYQIRITPEIHANIWILGKYHLLTVEPLKESIREGNLGLTSMSGHKVDPSLHSWLSQWR